jgi:hypothetical protein
VTRSRRQWRRAAAGRARLHRAVPDAETGAIAKTIGQVLWDDLNFEREFAFIPRDVYATVPRASSFNDIPFDRWRELNADGLDHRDGAEGGERRSRRSAALQRAQRQMAYGPRQYDSANARLIRPHDFR